MMVSESATVSGFILLANHRSSTYAITYDAVYSEDRRRDELHAGTETARSGQRGDQAESEAKTETALFGVRIRRSFVGLRKSGSG